MGIFAYLCWDGCPYAAFTIIPRGWDDKAVGLRDAAPHFYDGELAVYDISGDFD